VQEHRRQERQDRSDRAGMGIAREDGNGMVWNRSELIQETVECARANRNFPQENEDIENDQKIVDERRREARLIVAEGNHSIGNL